MFLFEWFKLRRKRKAAKKLEMALNVISCCRVHVALDGAVMVCK
jgi:hypothetical protein